MKNQKTIKIIIALLIVVMISSSLFMVTSCENAEEETPAEKTQEEKETIFTIGVLADPHMMAEEVVEDPTNIYFSTHQHNTPFRELDISEAIYKTAVDDVITQNVDVVFLIGDLVNNGNFISEKIVAEGCAKLKAAGIQVFVASGICDTATNKHSTYMGSHTMDYSIDDEYITSKIAISPQEFTEIFADYGYNQACFKDTNSISYAADIEGTNYRVLMLENTMGYKGNVLKLENMSNHPMTDAQLAWIESVLQDSQRVGKEVFVVSSLPIEEYMVPYYTYFMRDAYLTLDRGAELQKMFLDYGVNYVFSGHLHIDAENQKTDENGNFLNEITTTSLDMYPSAYNIVEIKDDFTYLRTSKRIAALKNEYVPSYASEADRIDMTSDFDSYFKSWFKTAFIERQKEKVFNKGADVQTGLGGQDFALHFLSELQIYPAYTTDGSGSKTNVLDEVTNAKLELIDKDLCDWMCDFDAIKLYGSGNTVEGILAPYGIAMPDSKFTNATVLDYIMDVVYRMLEGSFTLNDNTQDPLILRNIFFAGLKELAKIDILDRLNELEPDVKACDMTLMVDNMLRTGTLDLKNNDFLLSIISLFFPYFKSKIPVLYTTMRNINDAASLLNSISLVMPVVSAGIPDLIHFTNEKGELENSYISLSKGEIYVDALISDMLFPVIARTAIIL